MFLQLMLAIFACFTSSSVLLLFCGCAGFRKKKVRSTRVTRSRPIVTNRPKPRPKEGPVHQALYILGDSYHLTTLFSFSISCLTSAIQSRNGCVAADQQQEDVKTQVADPKTAMRSMVDVNIDDDIQAPRAIPLDEKAKRIKEENLKKNPKDNNPYPTIEGMMSVRNN